MDLRILVLPGALATGVAAARDMLATAEVLAPKLELATPRWCLSSLHGGPVALAGGFQVDTRRLPVRDAPTTQWVVPGISVHNAAALEQRLQAADARAMAGRIAAHVRRGGQVAATCSAVFLLERAGVLEGRQVTTAWWLASALARCGSAPAVHAERVLQVDGPITTAGAAFALPGMLLQVLAQRFGARLAEAVARILVIERAQAQAPFVIPALLASGDTLVSTLTRRIEAALPEVPPVAALASALCVSERTLSRRVRQATGRNTVELIQAIRLSHARHLLEHSRLPIEEIAHRVGYRDATALRRLMRKRIGATPRQLRVVRE